jgi:hypothetical protein
MKIEGIKKVTLSIKWGGSMDELDNLTEAFSLEFIYGIGAAGLSPFEVSLSGKESGCTFSFKLRTVGFADYFKHLLQSFHAIPKDMEEIYFSMNILDVSESGPKEVIKAMAEMAACGDHCCGGH